ncbi:MAG: 30S ribosomal protein S4 [Candidatus Zambryskibacteria bacterium]|nr:30S ribosomal protein S4 [Candidatus Zambryskibacteria bacterium]
MKIGPKYKIARRLKAPIFEKTQTQKYSLREGRKTKSKSFGRPKTDFGIQMNEKQKARMFYGVTEKQFSKYVKEALNKKAGAPMLNLLYILEHRLDNVIWRASILPTHLAARQAVAHGHFLVNGKKVYVPSYQVKERDKITIREGSKNSKLFSVLDEKKEQENQMPDWLLWDNKKKELSIKDTTFTGKIDLLFDLGQVIEYYQR